MSLRTRAGGAGGPIPGLAPGITAPRATWPATPARLPLSSRGAAILGAEVLARPLTLRDREQLVAAPLLAPNGVAPVGITVPLATVTSRRTWAPVMVDRGFRVPYVVPRTPGSGGGAGGPDATAYPGNGKGGCC